MENRGASAEPRVPQGATTGVLLKDSAECNSGDTDLGKFDTLEDCAEEVKDRGGTYFIYGKGHKQGKCYIEKTASADCPEGWEGDQYGFYEVTGDRMRSLLLSTLMWHF